MNPTIYTFHQFIAEQNQEIQCSLEKKTPEIYRFLRAYFPDLPISIEKFLENPNAHTAVARHDGEIVGVNLFNINTGLPGVMIPSGVSFSQEKIHSNYTVVKEDWRGKGINKKLKDEVDKFARERGIDVITANVAPDNGASSNSLTNMGFSRNPNPNEKGLHTHWRSVENT